MSFCGTVGEDAIAPLRGFDVLLVSGATSYLMVARCNVQRRQGSEVLNKDIFKVFRLQEISTPVVSLHFFT